LPEHRRDARRSRLFGAIPRDGTTAKCCARWEFPTLSASAQRRIARLSLQEVSGAVCIALKSANRHFGAMHLLGAATYWDLKLFSKYLAIYFFTK
jgi:hypothetical protein